MVFTVKLWTRAWWINDHTLLIGILRGMDFLTPDPSLSVDERMSDGHGIRHCREEGCMTPRFPSALGNLLVVGDVQPHTSLLGAVPYFRMYQEIHSYRAISIDSVNINTSLVLSFGGPQIQYVFWFLFTFWHLVLRVMSFHLCCRKARLTDLSSQAGP